MLTIHILSERFEAEQARYPSRDTRIGTQTAVQLMGLRRAMETMARHFNRLQRSRSAAGKSVIPHAHTLGRVVGAPSLTGSAILEGVHKTGIIAIGAGRWLIQFDDRPPSQHEYGELTMFAL